MPTKYEYVVNASSRTELTQSRVRGVVGEVEEEHDVLHGAVLLEVLLEESRRLHVHTHRSEHDGEVVIRRVLRALPTAVFLRAASQVQVREVHEAGLSHNLRRNLFEQKNSQYAQ